MHTDGRKNGLNTTLAAAKIPDEVAERIRADKSLEGEPTFGLKVKKILLDLYSGVEAVDVRSAKAV